MQRIMIFALTICCAVVILGCGETGNQSGGNEITQSYAEVEKVTARPYDEVIAGIEGGVKGLSLLIIGDPNYKSMQQMVGRQIRNVKAYFIFRPDLGTTVFENDYNAALEIPLKILIYDRGDGSTVVRYRKPTASFANYSGLSGFASRLDEILEKVSDAGVGEGGSKNEIKVTISVVEKIISSPFDETIGRLESAIKGSNLLVVLEPNYKTMQRMVGRQIRDAKSYFIFRPDLGTPVFENDYNGAMEIPLKILVYDRGDGKTAVRYWKPSSALGNHKGLSDFGKSLDQILEQITKAAAPPA